MPQTEEITQFDSDIIKREDRLQLYTYNTDEKLETLPLWLSRTYEFRLSTQAVVGPFTAQFVYRNPANTSEFIPASNHMLVGITFGVNEPGAPAFHEAECIKESVKWIAQEGGEVVKRAGCICLSKRMEIITSDDSNAPFEYLPVE